MAKDQDKKAAAQDKLELVQSADAVKQDKKTVRMPRRLRKEKGKEKTRKSRKGNDLRAEKGHLAYPQGIHQLQRMRFVFVAVMALIVWLMDLGSAGAYQACLPIRLRDCLRCSSSRGVAANE